MMSFPQSQGEVEGMEEEKEGEGGTERIIGEQLREAKVDDAGGEDTGNAEVQEEEGWKEKLARVSLGSSTAINSQDTPTDSLCDRLTTEDRENMIILDFVGHDFYDLV